MMKHSKIKSLYSAGNYVRVKSLVDGTATRGERMLFIGIFVALTAFCFVFVGVSLMVVGHLLLAVILPVGAGHVLYKNVHIAVHQYRAAQHARRQKFE
jgi:CHASE2 domain-containing sensor protein